jgi:hypothetical protein
MRCRRNARVDRGSNRYPSASTLASWWGLFLLLLYRLSRLCGKKVPRKKILNLYETGN